MCVGKQLDDLKLSINHSFLKKKKKDFETLDALTTFFVSSSTKLELLSWSTA